MTSNKLTTFVMHIILTIIFLGLINMIFDLHRFAFYGEILILLVLFPIAIVSIIGIGNNFRWAWVLSTLFFAFVALDMLFIKALLNTKPDFFLHLMVVAIVGFFISLFSIESPKEESKKVEEKEVKKSFKPGKYIASKTGTKYHAPKCDWAKRVKKKNAVWFDSKEEAKKAGYKKDTCVK